MREWLGHKNMYQHSNWTQHNSFLMFFSAASAEHFKLSWNPRPLFSTINYVFEGIIPFRCVPFPRCHHYEPGGRPWKNFFFLPSRTWCVSVFWFNKFIFPNRRPIVDRSGWKKSRANWFINFHYNHTNWITRTPLAAGRRDLCFWRVLFQHDENFRVEVGFNVVEFRQRWHKYRR